MSDRIGRAQPDTEENTSFTQKLRVLSERTTTALDVERDAVPGKRALLVCADSSAAKWGPRWLGQSGFDVAVADDAGRAAEEIKRSTPDLVVVQAGIKSPGGDALYAELQRQAGDQSIIFVLCNSSQEINDAIDAGVHDVARKPVDWQLLARRANYTVTQLRKKHELEETRASLKSALEVANQARKKLRRTEAFEPVTGLPNRSRFVELVAKGMKAAERDRHVLAVFAVGFDRLGMVLEALGRSEADAVTSVIAGRLNDSVRAAIDVNPEFRGLKTAVVGKLGHSRFGIMMSCSEELAEAHALVREIGRALKKPAVVAGQTIFLSTITGAALFPQDGGAAEALVVRAEAAMRDAGARGSSCRFFSAEMDAAAARRLKIEQQLYTALEQKELKLAYQPIVDVASNQVVGAEALIRWPQSDGSFIGPEEFVPIAEDAGFMISIGEFVIEEACRQLSAWRDSGMNSLTVAVNIARCQLMDPGLVDFVNGCLEKYGVEPALLDFELSERGALSGDESVLSQLFQLKSLGITISIDDFGTGEASIAYLKEMPVDHLKIDRSYIARLAYDGKESRMISAMIALAHRLQLKVVAEGIESAAQLNILQSLECDLYQGFHFSRAVDPELFPAVAFPQSG